MKTATQFFSVMITVLIIALAGSANAQRRAHQNNDYRHNGLKKGHDHQKVHHHKPHRHDRVRVIHPVVKHHHTERVVTRHYRPHTRYIYYRDYDVYYDLHRNVYITYSGRNWSLSTSLPVVLHRVDTRRAVRMEVDYYQDDFPRYLERERPAYRAVYTAY